ncbi:hypothetical protein TSUD_61460 [Trifolium subterraneum]|uniref:Uncharacterized protein n=1 Tax=Trifolium subterraneum TaxID=3900 RepID=A0A2Z6NL14_TRISU|nr:hypothetical protein TSUD_61460 [Trifolium subterraneum]
MLTDESPRNHNPQLRFSELRNGRKSYMSSARTNGERRRECDGVWKGYNGGSAFTVKCRTEG